MSVRTITTCDVCHKTMSTHEKFAQIGDEPKVSAAMGGLLEFFSNYDSRHRTHFLSIKDVCESCAKDMMKAAHDAIRLFREQRTC